MTGTDNTQTMTAVVLHAPNDLKVEQVPMPQVRPAEVLLKMGACGICGSDLRYMLGENPWAKHTLGHQEPNPPDMVLGHEIAGSVMVGGNTRRVAAMAFRTCGACVYCRTGRSNLCPNTQHLGHGAGWDGQNPGGMAEFCPVWENRLFDLPDCVGLDEATLCDGLGVAVHAANQISIVPSEPVLVLGGGPIGLSIAQVVAARGANPVVITDVYDAPLECGVELGLGPCLNVASAADAEVVAELRRAAGGNGFIAAFDTTGQLAVQQQALAVLDRGGMLVAMAGVADRLTLTESSLAGERRLTTCSNNFVKDFETGLRLLVSGQVRVKPMITHTFALQDACAAFTTAINKHETNAIKVILEP